MVCRDFLLSYVRSLAVERPQGQKSEANDELVPSNLHFWRVSPSFRYYNLGIFIRTFCTWSTTTAPNTTQMTRWAKDQNSSGRSFCPPFWFGSFASWQFTEESGTHLKLSMSLCQCPLLRSSFFWWEELHLRIRTLVFACSSKATLTISLSTIMRRYSKRRCGRMLVRKFSLAYRFARGLWFPTHHTIERNNRSLKMRLSLRWSIRVSHSWPAWQFSPLLVTWSESKAKLRVKLARLLLPSLHTLQRSRHFRHQTHGQFCYR